MRVKVSPKARADIRRILAYTLRTWGKRQYVAYNQLMDEAVADIQKDPRRGRNLTPNRPNCLGFRITKFGRKARHVMFYRMKGDLIQIIRVLHDSADFERHL